MFGVHFKNFNTFHQQDTKMINYRAPHLGVDFLNANFSGNHEDVQVLDVACGSGLVAKLVSQTLVL